MPRQKKSRKVGKIGISKAERPVSPKISPKQKNRKGNKAGSRHSAEHLESSSNKDNSSRDPRLGSKKPIDLHSYKNQKEIAALVKKRFYSPQEELDAIENDSRLEQLLEKQESKRLTLEEQQYLDKTMARHKQLCELLGIEFDDNDDEESDPFSNVDAINIDDYKN